MTGREAEGPFTVFADFDLAPRPGLALRAQGADVTVRRAAVPDSLPGADARGPAWEHAGGRLLIRHQGGVRFLIEGGDTIRYEAKPGTLPDEIGIFLFGSPWAAVALQRGLLPLHASAVVSRAGAVHAFTGASGVGKSTLAAALGRHGLPFFADDLLLLDPASFGEGCLCYRNAGLKLFPDALALTDAIRASRCTQACASGGRVRRTARRTSWAICEPYTSCRTGTVRLGTPNLAPSNR